MKLNFDELRILKFGLEAANSEISRRISVIDPRFFSRTEEIDKSAEENLLEEIKLLQERINKDGMRKFKEIGGTYE